MDLNLEFNWPIMDTIAGGKSALDIPGLEIDSELKASLFLKSYGFDPEVESDVEKLWYYHRRSIVLISEKLGYPLNEIPEILTERKKLEDISKLLFFASPKNNLGVDIQKWSCAILRCIHVFVHAENDLFNSYSEEIQKQVLSEFQKYIIHDGQTHKTFLTNKDTELIENLKPTKIELVHFQSKPFKTSSSTVIKLLARPEALAMNIFDKLGVRFVTRNVYDVFSVLRFLIDQQVISFPHTMPDQSSNNLYPLSIFRQAIEKWNDLNLKEEQEEIHINDFFKKYIKDNIVDSEIIRKFNDHSHDDFKFIKFITRKLIQIEKDGKRIFNFFFPYEVQIMDESSYKSISSGPSSHDSYKDRQKAAARKRLFST